MNGCEGRLRVTAAQNKRRSIKKTHKKRCQTEFKLIKKSSHKLTHTHRGASSVTAVSLRIRHPSMATHLDLPTLPVSTNIGFSSHTDTQTHTWAQTTTHAHAVPHTHTYKSRERQPAEGGADDGFKYRRDERARLRGLTGGKRMEGDRQGESSEGEHGQIKGLFQSQSLVGLFGSWWLSAGMRTNTDKCDAETGLHAELCRCTHTHTVLCIHREADTQTHHYHR